MRGKPRVRPKRLRFRRLLDAAIRKFGLDEAMFERGINVREKLYEGILVTVIDVNLAVRGGAGVYRFTTEPQFVSSAQFDTRTLEEIHRAAGHPGGLGAAARRSAKGRVIYALHPSFVGVAAAIALHVPEEKDEPLLVRVIALRHMEGAAVAEWSFALAVCLKACAHIVGKKAGRNGDLVVEPGSERERDFYERFSFVRVADRDGQTVLRQSAF